MKQNFYRIVTIPEPRWFDGGCSSRRAFMCSRLCFEYVAISTRVAGSETTSFCESSLLGGIPAKIPSIDHFRVAQSLVISSGLSSMWIGLTDPAPIGTGSDATRYQWTDGSQDGIDFWGVVANPPWQNDQPDGEAEGGDCVA